MSQIVSIKVRNFTTSDKCIIAILSSLLLEFDMVNHIRLSRKTGDYFEKIENYFS